MLLACSAEDYRKDADLEVGKILAEKEQWLFNKSSGFTLEMAKDALHQELVEELEKLRHERQERRIEEVVPKAEADEEAAKAAAEAGGRRKKEISPDEADRAEAVRVQLEETLAKVERRHAAELVPFAPTAAPLLPRRVFSLNEALDIAADNSRDYQTQKEQVYFSALDLTLQRYAFETRFGVTVDYDWSSVPNGSKRLREGALTTNFSLTKTLATGGVLVFDFTTSLLRRFTGVEFGNGTNHSTSSFMDLGFSQPLLQGFGKDIVQEPLLQAERNTFYELRSFERFRQQFAVQVASEYYGLVQQIDEIDNARRSYVQFINSREQAEALATRGRRSQIQLDQARQSELAARNSWITSQRSYQDALDRFKITLGLPMESDIAPDPAELDRLREKGQVAGDLGEDEAIAVALELRLDYLNDVDQLSDRDRQVKVAEDDLRAALNVDAGVSVPMDRDTVFDTQGGHATWRAGAHLDLPVDKKAERNSYRVALILRDEQERAVSLSGDQVKQDVRDALRRLAQLRETYQIALESVEVAERRVQSTSLTLRMGRIEIRDALDATDALNGARNSLTSALVDYELARLEFARDTGLLGLEESGIVVREPPPEPPSEPPLEE